MYQTIITEREAGQRLDKYLHRLLPNAGSGFLYKMLRKKNITLNDKKADGSEKIVTGDCVKVFFAPETLSKFMGTVPDAATLSRDGVQTAGDEVTSTDDLETFIAEYEMAYEKLADIQVIYENDHVLIADKPAGILSQKAEKTDLSLNEWLIGYLLRSGFLTADGLRFFKPSVCNRLDRNTSGIVLCAKSLQGAQLLGKLLKERTLHKYYQTYVKGQITQAQLIEGVLWKDEQTNRVTVSSMPKTRLSASQHSQKNVKDNVTSSRPPKSDAARIKTAYRPLRIERDKTLLEVQLFTGKSHQIRAHLASIGHPLLGDYKYGDKKWNESYRQKYGVQAQLLHAYQVVFPLLDAPFADLSGRTFSCEMPEIFERVSELN